MSDYNIFMEYTANEQEVYLMITATHRHLQHQSRMRRRPLR